MKTRLAILIAVALVAAACSSSNADSNAGFLRTTTSGAPTTTSTPTTADSPGGTTPTTIEGALPTNPDPVDSGGTDTPEVTLPLEVEPCDPPSENLEAYCQPFELVLGNTRIVWDRWFWGQGTFSKGTVEVYHGDELVAAGPFIGEGSIVEQDEDDNFIFYDPNGTVVAIASPDDITPAIQDVLDDLNS
ncbi:MAG: hypothetical protein KJP22_14415 [Acidimicrobiia bacterium]|nr:hypothetical protein [Acidimicrobiia bacterium]MBT8246454.1 hypothetical protein [Acidimicrobiia bacterium]NNF87281.1 hypothetical protein [Acidimicrobiia bacterium]NNJ48038.1 hypothetical protein [Acidimicrobiia bacterium]